MVRKRESKQIRNANQVRTLEEDFLNQVDKFTLADLTLEQLADRYKDIDRQSQMMKGLILLEARNRFSSNQEFGNWVVNIGLSDDSFQNRNLFMNLARFFQNRKMSGISLTSAYEISRPSNEGVAEKVYEYALNKNLSVAEIKRQIQLEKGLTTEVVITTAEPKLLPLEDFDVFKQAVLSDVGGLSGTDAIRVLQDCIKEIRYSLSHKA
ncbi:MAG: hypothetical protein WCL34_01545 [Methylococcaceae bacterium]